MAIRDINRYQMVLENQLEDWVSPDNPVRFISALVLKFYNEKPHLFQNDKGHKKTGRRAYNPAAMLMLFLYGYLNRINSSRRLEAETYRNMEVIWLLGNDRPDHKTISDFRKDNGKLISSMAKEFRLFLKNEGFISGSIQAFDGTKVKALAKKDSINLNDVKKRIFEMEKDLESYVKLLDSNDCKENQEDLATAPELEVIRLNAQIAHLTNQLNEQTQLLALMEEKGIKDYYSNDADARKMKSLDGYMPGYNVQMGVDSKNMMITSDFVSLDGGDQKLLRQNIEASKEQIGIYPDTALADKGYATTSEMMDVEANGFTECIVAMPETTEMRKEALGVTFEYNQELDCFQCAKGEKLVRKFEKTKNEECITIYQVTKNPCKNCSLFGVCTKDKTHGRRVEVRSNFKEMMEFRRRSKTEEYIQKFQRRKAIIEHVFGTIKTWMGKIPLLLTTKKKVQIEVDLYATCYNLRRLFNICPMSELLNKLDKYATQVA